MNIPNVSIKQLLEAGVHLGHKETLRWNPKMKNFYLWRKKFYTHYRFTQTVSLIKKALMEVHKCIASGGKILIVSKKQASETVLK